MSPILIIVLFFLILIGLIAGSSLTENRTIRIGFGIGTLIWAAFIFIIVNVVQTLNFNSAYNSAASSLLKETESALKNGHSQEVLTEYKKMNEQLRVTYENKGNFEEIAKEAAYALKNTRPSSESN